MRAPLASFPVAAIAIAVFGLLGCDEEPGRLIQSPDAGPHRCASDLPTWQKAPPLKSARGALSVVGFAGRVLAVGGAARAELYDRREARWEAIEGPARERIAAPLLLLADGRVLLADSLTPEGEIAPSEIYDPTTSTWETIGSMQSGAAGTLTELPDETILAAGGRDAGGAPLSRAEIFEPGEGRWTATGPMAGARADHGAVRLPDGRVLVVGGSGPGGVPLASAEVYDPETGAFTSTAPMSQARRAPAVILLADERVLVAGGEGAGGEILDSAELYLPKAKKWSEAAPMAVARAGAAITGLRDGRVLVAGGRGPAGEPRAEAELFDLMSMRWRQIEPMAAARSGHGQLLFGAQVFVVGGTGTGGPLRAAELLCPPPRPNL